MSIFSNTNVEANADNTKNDVDTGTPNLVNATSNAGAVAWYHCTSCHGILFKRP